MLFEEKEVRHDHVGFGNRRLGLGQRLGRFGPFGGRVDRHVQPGEILRQFQRCPRHRTRRVAVQCDDGDVIRPGFGETIAHSEPSPRKAYRR